MEWPFYSYHLLTTILLPYYIQVIWSSPKSISSQQRKREKYILLIRTIFLFIGDEDIEISGPDYDEDPADMQLLQDVDK